MEPIIDFATNIPMDLTDAQFDLLQAKEQFINICSSAMRGCAVLPLNEYLESLRGGVKP